jgi:hypothetical protein
MASSFVKLVSCCSRSMKVVLINFVFGRTAGFDPVDFSFTLSSRLFPRYIRCFGPEESYRKTRGEQHCGRKRRFGSVKTGPKVRRCYKSGARGELRASRLIPLITAPDALPPNPKIPAYFAFRAERARISSPRSTYIVRDVRASFGLVLALRSAARSWSRIWSNRT